MDFWTIIYGLICSGIVLVALMLLGLFLYMYLTTETEPSMLRFEEEKTFLDPVTKRKLPFPSIFDKSTVSLSIVVPAYNEQERMPAMLNEAMEFLLKKAKLNKDFSFEVIVVDDGSKDETTATALLYCEKYGCDKVRVLTLKKNRGKGGAIKMGVLSSRGNYILFADADGATTFEDYDKLESEMNKLVDKADEDSNIVVCGSRAHLEEEAIAQRSFFRTILMKGFHFLVWFLCVRGVRDTQCGFKLMNQNAARKLFTNLHVERWAFDVELLYIAQCLNMTLSEVAVRWQEIEGSKLVPFWSWLQMGRDLLFIRMRYVFRLWRISS